MILLLLNGVQRDPDRNIIRRIPVYPKAVRQTEAANKRQKIRIQQSGELVSCEQQESGSPFFLTLNDIVEESFLQRNIFLLFRVLFMQGGEKGAEIFFG